ncbi:biotin--protein ligase-like [Pecten maximus]|uniref:biotin--protein ligase-like n=1 Tax=Pecten maximus TaxID=6579 RepID=UPI00145896CF|nr:biotin--protein ligase-like [Pecten maximus]XP_033745185.1 biotin--protein ligase-like [Pecten maximus]XP_033745186.1 biotin--protein ligase-like [Pecten maximus]XP_033745187.1 biotin--protein ligase-like [Pecten maximus]XP_033745188.1 biotin--protein ligase-like [Pecten maximus]XP_033745189.1 biotin--protein ligase-like [Pecten maximus]
MSTVYLYDGPGADDGDSEIIVRSLQKSLKPTVYSISKISPGDIIQGNWTSTAAAFIMPGGFDRGFIDALGDSGATVIRDYVRNGGSYLGLGAGSYYACDNIEFDRGGPNEVIGDRPLKFFPGSGIGPAYGPFSYEDERGARAAAVDFYQKSEPGSISSKIYFNGGNLFVPHSKESSKLGNDTSSGVSMETFESLGIYSGLPSQPLAIVKCKVGTGVAVLSGVQLEFRSSDLDGSNPYLKDIKKELESYDVTNNKLWCSALQENGIRSDCLSKNRDTRLVMRSWNAILSKSFNLSGLVKQYIHIQT